MLLKFLTAFRRTPLLLAACLFTMCSVCGTVASQPSEENKDVLPGREAVTEQLELMERKALGEISEDQQLWMGQVIIRKQEWAYVDGDCSKKGVTCWNRKNYNKVAEITLTGCGRSRRFKVNKVSPVFTLSFSENSFSENHKQFCNRKRKGSRLSGTVHPGNSSERHVTHTGKLHKSPACPEPSGYIKFILFPDGNLRLSAGGEILQKATRDEKSTLKFVCPVNKSIQKALYNSTTIDCGVKEHTDIQKHDEGILHQTTFTHRRPPIPELFHAVDQTTAGGNLIFGNKPILDKRAVKKGDTAQLWTLTYFFSTSPVTALNECLKAARTLLEECTNSAFHKFDFEYDREKVEEKGAKCDQEGLIKCQSSPEYQDCIDLHCTTDLFPDSPDETLEIVGLDDGLTEQQRNVENLIHDLNECTGDYIVHKLHCRDLVSSCR